MSCIEIVRHTETGMICAVVVPEGFGEPIDIVVAVPGDRLQDPGNIEGALRDGRLLTYAFPREEMREALLSAKEDIQQIAITSLCMAGEELKLHHVNGSLLWRYTRDRAIVDRVLQELAETVAELPVTVVSRRRKRA